MNELLYLLLDMFLRSSFVWAVSTGIAIPAYFFFTDKEYDINSFDIFFAGMLPKFALIYNEDTRFGIFALLYTFICIVISGPLQLLGSACLLTTWCITNLIGFIIDLPFFACRVMKRSKKTHTVCQKDQVQEHDQLVSETHESELTFIDITLETLEN